MSKAQEVEEIPGNSDEYPQYVEQLYDADPDCDHHIKIRWSGYGCIKCSGWFCL